MRDTEYPPPPPSFHPHLLVSLHFGWISCASLVNLNGYFASIPRLTNRFKLVASVLTIIAATVLGAVITRIREDPLYVAVLAWALWAVGSPAGWSGLEVRYFSCIGMLFFFCRSLVTAGYTSGK